MGFGQAIAVCLRKYAGFRGRARRAEYWWFTLFYVLLAVAALVVDFVLGTIDMLAGLGLAGGILTIVLFLPSIAVTVRRLHDVNYSGLWLLGYYALLIAVLVYAGMDMELVRTGAVAPIYVLAGALMLFATSAWLLVLLVLKGTNGTNRFGPDPLAGNPAEEFS
jgi:uncharacterized membrane protein YhaH (DUF805 family)